MPLDAPFRIGRFLVDCDGKLNLGTPDAAPALYLRWHGLAVSVHLTGSAAGGRLALSAIAGRVPSSASSPGGARREQALATLQALGAAMGGGS